MLLPHCRPAIPQHPSTVAVPIPLETLRNRRPHSHGLRPPPPDRVPVAHRPMPATLLEPGLSGHAGSHSHDSCLCSRGH